MPLTRVDLSRGAGSHGRVAHPARTGPSGPGTPPGHGGTASVADALERLLHTQRDQVQASLAASAACQQALDQLATQFREVLEQPSAGTGPVDPLVDTAQVAELVTTARTAVLSMRPGAAPSAEELAASLDRARGLLQRGVSVRVIYPESFRSTTRLRRYLREAAEMGVQCRYAADVPLRLVVIDGSSMLLPENAAEEGGGLVLVRSAPLVSACLAFYELCWQNANCPDGAPPARRLSPDAELTDVQRVALRMMAEGAKDDRIGRALGVSRRTVSRIISELLDFLGTDSRFQAGIRAMQNGWIGPS
ncbi:helix-turn-helix domain-containing protein [Kitasatospora mediocidica]|uniref:helix-turn-helix domain-containing protein n=1 Tax=Kitasatospora mediocidica TaxID=58352 RepID=UPI00055C1669|nr:helix-turn-helix domain-containing protein [Kitasatospora mediocidica]